MKKLLLLTIGGFMLILIVSIYVTARTAASFGYHKGFEQGVKTGIKAQQMQQMIDESNSLDSIRLFIEEPKTSL